nr:hypothetical protein [uncultured Draconibacterium sp.]
MNEKNINILFILLCICAFEFYRPTFFPRYSDISKYIFELTAMTMLAYAVFFAKNKYGLSSISRIGFTALFLAMGTSIYMAYRFNNQHILQGFTSTMPYLLAYATFFIFSGIKVNPFFMERCINYFAVITMVLMVVNLLLYPNVPFGSADISEMRGGLIRVRLPGYSSISFFFMYNIHRYTLFKNKTHLRWLIVCIFFIVLTLSRQLILFNLLFGGLLFLNHVKWHTKLVFVLFSLALFVFIMPRIGLFQSLTEITKNQLSDEDDVIRFSAWDYYTKEIQPDSQCYFWGTGVPNANSSYGQKFYDEITELKVFFVDIGYGGFFFLFGTLGIIGLATLLISAFFYKGIFIFSYVKYFLAINLAMGFTSGVVIYQSQIMMIMMALYFLTFNDENRNYNIKLQ